MPKPIVSGLWAAGLLFAITAHGTALHDAARQGDVIAVERLLADGADIEGHDDEALTPLIVAALAGQSAVVASLIEHGADPRGRDGNGYTALHAAAYSGHPEIVETLVDAGADIDDQDNRARISALHAAAERNHLEIAAFLLERGATVDLVEGSGWTPVMRATFKSHPEMVKLLRSHGAECSDAAGEAFLSYCEKGGR